MFRAYCPPGLTDAEYEAVRDIALVEALQAKGWIIANIAQSAEAIIACYVGKMPYPKLLEFFQSKLPFPPPTGHAVCP